ncbi:MAG: serpin family protein, partial [candidate division WOR-3 bacterium]
GRFLYLKKENWAAVALPYGKGEMSIYLFLPDTNFPLASLVQWLGGRWEEVLKEFDEREGEISLPRIHLTYEKSFKEILKRMNMAIAFDPKKADFTGMSGEGGLFINDVRHKTYLSITEEGTEAAAVTSVEMALTALPERFHLVFNRPFFFAIRDNRTGLILFTGAFFTPKG